MPKTKSETNPDNLTAVSRLSRDIAVSSITLSKKEARFLVDAYYTMQDQRIRFDGQIRAMGGDQPEAEPHAVLSWMADQGRTLENQVKRALDTYSENEPLGAWARSICGIGPVLAAGLLAHIDIEKAPTAGHIWSFAGMESSSVWEKGQKRPWNADLKVICYKIGESFIKVQSNENDIYGKLYAERKASEADMNERGLYATQAAEVLSKKKIGKDTDAYKAYSVGKLPPAHLHARARRYAIKLFLAHYQEAAYWLKNNYAPPKPYSQAILGHAHIRGLPNAHLIPGHPLGAK